MLSIFGAALGLFFCCVCQTCGFAVFKCSFLVSLWRALLDQVCWVQEMLPVLSRSCQWTVVPYGKLNLVPTQLTLWKMQFGCFRRKSSAMHLQLCLLTASPVKWRAQLTLKWIWFGFFLFIVLLWIFSAVLGLSFCWVFWNCVFDVFKCSVSVSLYRALLDQVCWDGSLIIPRLSVYRGVHCSLW